MTLGEAKQQVLYLLDERRPKVEFLQKLNGYFDMAQRQVALVSPLVKTMGILQQNQHTRFLMPCLEEAFSARSHFEQDVFVPHEQGVLGVRAFCFMVDDQAQVSLEQQTPAGWVPIWTVEHTPTQQGFVPFRGLVEAQGAVRMRFSGSSFYTFKNTAFWGLHFSTEERIPRFSPYADYPMPADFHRFLRVIRTEDRSAVEGFLWEERAVLRLPYALEGDFVVEYEAYPPPITSETPDAQPLVGTQEAQGAYLYFVAAQMLSAEDDQRLFQSFYNQYQGVLLNMKSPAVNTVRRVKNTLFRGDCGA